MSQQLKIENQRTTVRLSRDINGELVIDCRPTGLARINVSQARVLKDFLDREIPSMEAAELRKLGQQDLFDSGAVPI